MKITEPTQLQEELLFLLFETRIERVALTKNRYHILQNYVLNINYFNQLPVVDPWRNGSASDSRSEGCVFDSRRVQFPFYFYFFIKRRRILLGRMRSFSARLEPKTTSYSIG